LISTELRGYLQGQRDYIDFLLGGSAIHAEAAPAWPEFGNAGFTWGLEAIGITPGYSLTGKGVAVAVLDTGLAANHPDFQALPAEQRWNFIADSDDVTDGNGHGTHCCGTVAGAAETSIGIRYGVAPEVKLLVGKVMDDDGTGFDSDILAGIAWAVHNGAQVISLSLGSFRPNGGAASEVYQKLAEDLEIEGRKCLMIAAAGNDSERSSGFIAPVGNPAACRSFMSVAAIDRNGSVADFSCGQTDNIGILDISGPGVEVLSAWIGENEYAELNGTSMATPHVAGVAALFLQQNPSLTPRQLWDLLEQKAYPLGSPLDFGRGCVQVP
jgi:subtilisin family serine protease